MNIHFALSLYWLLLPLAAGLAYWALYERPGERSTGYNFDFSPILRMFGAAMIFMASVCLLLGINLYLK
jgi:hypothetical protein